LDDPQLRELANRDPEVFLSQFRGRKLFIDEVQYAPNLFPSIKRQVDLWKRTNQSQQTLYRLTGSNQILLDKNVKESLAGRVSYFDMNTLSIHEIRKHLDVPIQTILYQGGWPELYATEGINAKDYLDDYINTYVEKDIVLSAGIQKRAEFLKFLRLLAGRVGQLVDYASLGRESGVEAKTAKEWLSVLEQMNLVCVTQPYSTNMSSRLVKAPKVYFIDTGLAARLQGWSSPGPILTSPQQGGLFENLVCSEIYKAINNFRLDWRIYHWRSRDNE
ncbi:MAG: ATP-binding protein, partial [Anaerolineae bacterium]|nr:ATP-binding protein [Anaerolineae bacterium]